MKKILLTGTAVLLLAITFRASAQELAANTAKKEPGREKKDIREEERSLRKEERAARQTEVSYRTKERFLEDFPDALYPTYSANNRFDEISFLENNHQVVAYYDGDYNLVGTVTSEQVTDLPAIAQKTINKKYVSRGYVISNLMLFDDNEANTEEIDFFDQSLGDQDMHFVELKKADQVIILQVTPAGDVSLFKKI